MIKNHSQIFFKYRTKKNFNESRLKNSIKWTKEYWYKIFKGKRKYKPCYSDISILLKSNISDSMWVSCTVKSKTWIARGK